MSEVKYSQDLDVLYISRISPDGRSVKTESIEDRIFLDFDEDTGELLGIEIIDFDGLKRMAVDE